MIRSYKFRIYPNKTQENELNRHLWISKNIWNDLLAFSKEHYQKFDMFPSRSALQYMTKGEGLYSQTQQSVSKRISESIMRVFKLKKKGIKCGFPRFKNIDRMRSLNYPQKGFKLEDKLKVTPFGELRIKQHRKIKGKIKTMSLKKEPTGKWFAVFTSEQTLKQKKNRGKAVGIDLGLTTFGVLSNGRRIKSSKIFKSYEEKLAFMQRKLSGSKRGSSNRKKARHKVALIHEKIANSRKDFLHKITSKLVSRYSLIALEKLDSKEMSENNFGKHIRDAGWGMFTNMLGYKAESAGSQVVFVDPKYTTQECSKCGTLSKKELHDRIHKCPSCKYKADRDFNAANVILNRATVGLTGSNACGVGALVPSSKQEAHTI